MTKRRTAAEIIAFHFCSDIRDVQETRYQSTRYVAPAVYVLSDDYYAAPADNRPPTYELGEPWEFVAEHYGRKIYCSRMVCASRAIEQEPMAKRTRPSRITRLKPAKFTPGPWRLSTGNMGNAVEGPSGRNRGEGDDGYRPLAHFQYCGPAYVNWRDEETNASANGRLIVAAPEYDALIVEAVTAGEIDADWLGRARAVAERVRDDGQ